MILTVRKNFFSRVLFQLLRRLLGLRYGTKGHLCARSFKKSFMCIAWVMMADGLKVKDRESLADDRYKNSSSQCLEDLFAPDGNFLRNNLVLLKKGLTLFCKN